MFNIMINIYNIIRYYNKYIFILFINIINICFYLRINICYVLLQYKQCLLKYILKLRTEIDKIIYYLIL